MPKLHIGKKIKEVLDKSNMTTVDFAKSINLTRNGAYKMFDKETIDTGQLKKISAVLGHDFFTYYRHETILQSKDPRNDYGYVTKDELDQAKRDIIKIFLTEMHQLRTELSQTKEKYKIAGRQKVVKKQLK